jgi:hypothetical protein
MASHLDVLELQLGYTDEDYRRNNLYSKLRPEIQRELDLRTDTPMTRQ